MKKKKRKNITIPMSRIEIENIEVKKDCEKMEEIRRNVKCLISKKNF